MKIAIAGFGVEGRSNYEYYRTKNPEATITIFDESEYINDSPTDTEIITGKGAFAKIQGYDLVLRSPSIPPKNIGQAKNQWSATREFMRECPAPIIGVTGSKGKGTTCSFIASILRRHFSNQPERRIHLVGNIGVPVLSVLPEVTADDIVVYELSSFQLWDCTQSPDVAVITMIEPDHLNVHDGYKDYVQAKLNIINYQHDGNMAVYNKNDDTLSELIQHIIVTTRSEGTPYPHLYGVHFDDSDFYMGEEIICPIDCVKLPGKHNLLNACGAISAVWDIIEQDREAIAKGLADFDGLPHRLKFVREVNGTKFYDDSIATTPGSAIAAIKSFDQPKVLILGGADKGADYHELGRHIDQADVRVVVAIGENREKIVEQISAETKTPIVQLTTKDMDEIVQTAYDVSCSGDVVIMSPAAASFDMFKSYVDRGQHFVSAVKKLENN